MRRIGSVVMLFLLASTITIMMNAKIVAMASPGAKFYIDPMNSLGDFVAPYQSNATSHSSSGLTGTTPLTDATKAYDEDLNTYAYFTYDATGNFELSDFQTKSPPYARGVNVVYFCMKYGADPSVNTMAEGDRYRIVYYVDPYWEEQWVTTTWLYGTSAQHADETEVWAFMNEPNDGDWSWTDITNLRLRIETSRVGAQDNAMFRLYEAWLMVYPGVRFDISVSGVEDLFGWDLSMRYNNTHLMSHRRGVAEGPFLMDAADAQGGADTYMVTNVYNDQGYMDLSCIMLAPATQGADGSGDLVSITFRILEGGGMSSGFDVYGVAPIDPDANDIPYELERVNIYALVKVAVEYGRPPPDPVYGDMNDDGYVDIFDLVYVAKNYGYEGFVVTPG